MIIELPQVDVTFCQTFHFVRRVCCGQCACLLVARDVVLLCLPPLCLALLVDIRSCDTVCRDSHCLLWCSGVIHLLL